MNGSIICGVDDSDSAKGAARVARELSARLGLRLVFVRVVEGASGEERLAAIASRLHDLADSATEVDCGAHWLVDVGHPADRLLAAAQDASAALIVVGSTGPRSSLLGSISADVSRRARCPVVVVAPGADRPLADKPRASSAAFCDRHAGAAGTARPPARSRRASEVEPQARAFAGGIVRLGAGRGDTR